jgi:TetR/AcrR family transcriptional regulator
VSSSGGARSGSAARSPRRAPAPDDRQRDAERSKQSILEAAVEEFSAKGFAGARVAEIAARAGVNAQLIAYYFGGKRGLYDTLRGRWESARDIFGGSDQPFPAVIGAYLKAVFDQPSWARLLVWQALGDGSERDAGSPHAASMADAVADIRQRQQRGELTSDFDPETILVVLWSAVMAPVTMPQVIQEACGADLHSAQFRARYAAQLTKLFAGPSAT